MDLNSAAQVLTNPLFMVRTLEQEAYVYIEPILESKLTNLFINLTLGNQTLLNSLTFAGIQAFKWGARYVCIMQAPRLFLSQKDASSQVVAGMQSLFFVAYALTHVYCYFKPSESDRKRKLDRSRSDLKQRELELLKEINEYNKNKVKMNKIEMQLEQKRVQAINKVEKERLKILGSDDAFSEENAKKTMKKLVELEVKRNEVNDSYLKKFKSLHNQE